MRRGSSYRGSDATFWRMVEKLLEEKEHIGAVGLHWASGTEEAPATWRLTVEGKDARREFDFPGVMSEGDEDWYTPTEG